MVKVKASYCFQVKNSVLKRDTQNYVGQQINLLQKHTSEKYLNNLQLARTSSSVLLVDILLVKF